MYKKLILTSFFLINTLVLPQVNLYAQEVQEGLDSSIEFLGRKCWIEIITVKEQYEKICDRLVITGAKRKKEVNFHFDNSDKDGMSFIVNPLGEKIVENDYLLLNTYKVVASFIWTKKEGLIEDTFVEGDGECRVLEKKILCMFNVENDLKIQAFLEF